ncbi:MAG TPA: hypothetical protein VIC57_16430 [Candidatus Dormibacteraeota bacterium]|jgi:hypothetical protein
MSTQDDDLKLEPPQGAPMPPAPHDEEPPAPPAERERPENELEAGRGRPMVEGPPMSVSEPISDSTINRTAGIAGLGLLGLGLLVALILLLVIVFAICR